MKWMTNDLVHYDRIVTPWLILRFIDPDAEFVFVPWGRDDLKPADAIPFGMPGVELSSHDKDGSAFQKVLRKYRLDDPALTDFNDLVSYGVKINIENRAPPAGDRRGQILEGVLAVTEGIVLSSKTDLEAIERMLPVFDGLYAMFVAERMFEARGDGQAPPDVGDGMWRTMFISSMAQRVRQKGGRFDGRTPFEQDEAFEAILGRSRAYLTAGRSAG